MKPILDYETVAYDSKERALQIIDQTQLPGEISCISLKNAKDIWDAIYLLKVRGAPAIGIAAAIGLAVLGQQIRTDSVAEFMEQLFRQKEYLNSARPTAVNLSWALNRVYDTCEKLIKASPSGTEKEIIKKLRQTLLQEAEKIKQEDIAVCRRIGEHGLTVLHPGDGILTHCNAGQLATCKYGTATAPIYLGQEQGYDFHVYADETRPLLQGARLTAFELFSAGVDVTLACDNMISSLMSQGKVQAVLVGCDRVAANGDTANKIGTSVVAVVAKYYHIPFYVCAPLSTIDWNTPSGDTIEIEQRDAGEVTHMWYQNPMTVSGVKVYNPAFDVTDHSLITGFITEQGIFDSLEHLKGKLENNSKI